MSITPNGNDINMNYYTGAVLDVPGMCRTKERQIRSTESDLCFWLSNACLLVITFSIGHGLQTVKSHFLQFCNLCPETKCDLMILFHAPLTKKSDHTFHHICPGNLQQQQQLYFSYWHCHLCLTEKIIIYSMNHKKFSACSPDHPIDVREIIFRIYLFVGITYTFH